MQEEEKGGEEEGGKGRKEREGKNETEHLPADVLAHLQKKNAPGLKESQAVLE